MQVISKNDIVQLVRVICKFIKVSIAKQVDQIQLRIRVLSKGNLQYIKGYIYIGEWRLIGFKNNWNLGFCTIQLKNASYSIWDIGSGRRITIWKQIDNIEGGKQIVWEIWSSFISHVGLSYKW